MTSKGEQTKFNHMLSCIKENKTIHKYELQDLCGLSVFSYNQLAGKFIHRYQNDLHQIEYDRRTMSFRWIETINAEGRLQ